MEQRSSQNKGQILTGSRLTDNPESVSRTHVNAESMDVPSCLTYMTLLQGDSDAGGGVELPYTHSLPNRLKFSRHSSSLTLL